MICFHVIMVRVIFLLPAWFMTCFRLWECGVVLAGVKAKPCGWPTASLDPSSGRRGFR